MAQMLIAIAIAAIVTAIMIRSFRKDTNRFTRAVCLTGIVLLDAGVAANATAIFTNGNRMPVLNAGVDWDRTPKVLSYDSPACGPLRWYLLGPISSSMVRVAYQQPLPPDDGLHVINPERVRFQFLTDIFHLTVCGDVLISASAGDFLIWFSTVLLFIAIVRDSANALIRIVRRFRTK